MSLDTADLQEIRNVIETANATQTQQVVELLQNEVRTLRNDRKEIYGMLRDGQQAGITLSRR